MTTSAPAGLVVSWTVTVGDAGGRLMAGPSGRVTTTGVVSHGALALDGAGGLAAGRDAAGARAATTMPPSAMIAAAATTMRRSRVSDGPPSAFMARRSRVDVGSGWREVMA